MTVIAVCGVFTVQDIISPSISEEKIITKNVTVISITTGSITPEDGMVSLLNIIVITVTIIASSRHCISSKSACALTYANTLIPERCSRFIISLSLHTDCMELKMPIQIHAQTSANAPFRVAL